MIVLRRGTHPPSLVAVQKVVPEIRKSGPHVAPLLACCLLLLDPQKNMLTLTLVEGQLKSVQGQLMSIEVQLTSVVSQLVVGQLPLAGVYLMSVGFLVTSVGGQPMSVGDQLPSNRSNSYQFALNCRQLGRTGVIGVCRLGGSRGEIKRTQISPRMGHRALQKGGLSLEGLGGGADCLYGRAVGWIGMIQGILTKRGLTISGTTPPHGVGSDH